MNLNHSEINVVFDVGANVGNWSKKVIALNPQVKIHAFEPVPDTFKKLEQNTIQFQNMIRNRMALSDNRGNISFNFYPNSSYFSSVFNHDLGKEVEKIEVEVISGDEYCQLNEINHIDFLKIDTEGFESKVLAGFEEMLKNRKINMVQFEYGPMAIDSKFLLCDFYEFFTSRGFKIGKIYPNWIDFNPYSKDMENFILSNFVALRNDSPKMIKG